MRKKVVSILVLFALVSCLIATTVSALSFTASMTPSKTTVAESTEFTVIVKVSNLEVGSNGINSLIGYLKYDSEVFDTINESNITALNSWSSSFDATTGQIKLTKGTFVTSTQEVFQIALKTKSGVSGKSGTISYTNIVASNSEANINATDISTSITIGTEQTSTNTSNGGVTVISNNTVKNNTTNTTNVVNTVNTVTANTVNIVTNSTQNNTTVSSYVNTTSEDDMPKTGVDDTVLGIMFIVITVAIGFYVKIEKINKDIK